MKRGLSYETGWNIEEQSVKKTERQRAEEILADVKINRADKYSPEELASALIEIGNLWSVAEAQLESVLSSDPQGGC